MAALAIKRISLIVAAVLVVTGTWWLTHAWLAGPHPFSSWHEWLAPAIALSVLGGVVGVAFILLESRWDRLAIALASWATFIFFWPADLWFVSALPLFLLLWFEASRRIRDDLYDRRRIRIGATLGRGVKLILLGAFLMVSLGFFLLPANREAGLDTVSQGVQNALQSAYEAPIVEQQRAELPPSLQAQFRRDLARTVDETVQDWLGPFRNFVPPFLAFALFLALWSVSFALREVALVVGRSLVSVMRATKFVRLEQKDVKAESLTI